MKLIVAIINKRDSEVVSEQLTRAGFSSTSAEGRGGFLKAESNVLLIGVDDMRVADVLRVIGEHSNSRESEVTRAPLGSRYKHPSSVRVGGAVVFVLSVEQFLKL